MGEFKETLKAICGKQELLKAKDELFKEFPILDKLNIEMRSINTVKENDFLCYRFGAEDYDYDYYKNKIKFVIEFNETNFKDDIFDKMKMSPEGSAYYYNKKDIAIHELAHVLQDYCIFKYLGIDTALEISKTNYKKLKNTDEEQKNIATSFLNTVIEKFSYKKFKDDEIDLYEIGKVLGINATNNGYEFFAECFNNYYHLYKVDKNTLNIREQKALEISSYVVDITKEYLKVS